jgi:PDZ domain-containing protein
VTEVDDPYRPSKWATRGLAALFLLVALGSVLALVPSNYVILKPGPTTNILGRGEGSKPIVTVTGHASYPARGHLNFTTVRQVGDPEDRASVLDVLIAAISPSQDVYDMDLLYPPGTTAKDAEAENAAEMTDSQQVATAVAARSIGAEVTERTIVSSVPDGSPAKDVLRGGDQITSIDGTSVSDGDQIRAAVQKHKPGESLNLVVLRNGKTIDLTTRTRDSDGRTVMGILLGRSFTVPFQVNIDVGQVGGPSAGLMLSLGIRDLLTPGDLTGGKDIAGTGTMSPDGKVGPIGGIAQKVVGARGDGADWFLAPADNCPDLSGRVPDGLHVVKVTAFDDALASVENIASGDTSALPHC